MVGYLYVYSRREYYFSEGKVGKGWQNFRNSVPGPPVGKNKNKRNTRKRDRTNGRLFLRTFTNLYGVKVVSPPGRRVKVGFNGALLHPLWGYN
jgi:hypothetical protein